MLAIHTTRMADMHAVLKRPVIKNADLKFISKSFYNGNPKNNIKSLIRHCFSVHERNKIKLLHVLNKPLKYKKGKKTIVCNIEICLEGTYYMLCLNGNLKLETFLFN